MKDRIKKYINAFIDWKEFQGLMGLMLFAVIITFFHLVYKYFEPDIIEISLISSFLDWITRILLVSCSWVLNNIFSIKSIINGEILVLPNQFMIHMKPGCSGLQQFFLVTILFILYPGPLKYKLWYIPLGILIVLFLNIIRFIGISLYSNWHPDHFRFVHDWIFRPFIYFIIFLLWVVWDTQVYRRSGEKNSGENNSFRHQG